MQRPTAAEAERKLMQAADQMSGTSLRSWSQEVIPQVLKARTAAPDSAGLLDRTVQLDAAPRVTLQADKPNQDADFHQARTQRLPIRHDKVVEPTGTAAKTPLPTKPTSSTPSEASPLRDILIVVLKGLVAGGLIGFLAVAALATYLIFLR